MARAFLVVMDSVGIGGAPDAGDYFNGDVPDTGANTLGHIIDACAAGQAEEGRSGPLSIPNLRSLGVMDALKLAAGPDASGSCAGAATGVSGGKETPSGHWKLAGVPEPPPLPSDFHVKLLQRRTITENTPVSLAPLAPEHSISDGESMDITAESPPRDFSFFQQELMKAYERIDEKRRNNPTPTRSAENRTVKRQDSSSSEASALKVFRHASTIMGVSTPPPQQETESDSGHDEPSDYNNSTVERAPNIPDFVFEGIAKSLSTTESEWSFDSATKSSLKNDKSKFNSIKRIKKSMKSFVSSISRNSGNKDISLPPSNDEAEESVVSYSDENWTLSGRTRSPRASVTQPKTFSPTHRKRSTAPLMDSPTRSLGSPDSTKR